MTVMPDPVSMTPVVGIPSVLTSTRWDPHFFVDGLGLVWIIMLVPGGLLLFWVILLAELSVFHCLH